MIVIVALVALGAITYLLVDIQPTKPVDNGAETEPTEPEMPDFFYEKDDDGRPVWAGYFLFANGDKMPVKYGTHVEYVIDPQTGLKARWYHNPLAIQDGIVTDD